MAGRRSSPFVITPFMHCVRSDPEYAQRTWSTLESAITKINERKTSELSFEELYRFSYNMVLHKFGDVLYDGLTAVLRDHLGTIAQSVSATDPAVFLSQLQNQWTWFKVSLNHIRDIMMYMDRMYAPPNKKKSVHDLGVALFRENVIRSDCINTRMVDTILSQIDCERNGEAIDTTLIRSVTRMLAELGDDKDGVTTVYSNVFENAFLDRTRAFYAREAQLYQQETTCSEYLRKAQRRMHEEETRVETYLDRQTGEKVRRVAEDELISKYLKPLVEMENSGLIWMLRNDKCYDLQLMYDLFRNIPDGENQLLSKLKDEVLERGNTLVNDSELANDAVALVGAIVALKEKYDRILHIAFRTKPRARVRAESRVADTGYGSIRPTVPLSLVTMSNDVVGGGSGGGGSGGGVQELSFNPVVPAGSLEAHFHEMNHASFGAPADDDDDDTTGPSGSSTAHHQQGAENAPDRKFVTAVNAAFERFVNSFAPAPQFISMYVDKLLRQDLKGTNDDEVETKLDMVMTLFRFLHDKDVFESYYKQHLCKRLLSNRTVSHDAEHSFISKLKNECGYLYTSKMETMFTDMRTSADTCDAFKSQFVADPDCDNVDISFVVLTTLSWPITNSATCTPPSAVSRFCERFEEFYYGKHNGRKLSWQMQMSNGEVRGTFGSGNRSIDISLSGYGICVLMLYNENDKLTFSAILERTGIPESDLKRTLQSLAMSKHRVLTKEPRRREILPTDEFIFNNDFTSKNRRIKVLMVSADKDNEEEKNDTRSRVDEDRKPLIEAAIVRVMKSRKVLDHQQLVAQVTAQVSSRFNPNPQDIKKRIESLVDRDFLERNADNRSTYTYIA